MPSVHTLLGCTESSGMKSYIFCVENIYKKYIEKLHGRLYSLTCDTLSTVCILLNEVIISKDIITYYIFDKLILCTFYVFILYTMYLFLRTSLRQFFYECSTA